MSNVFDAFRPGGGQSRRAQDTTAEMLFKYEEHYMRLVRNFRHEIEFINDLHASHTREVKNFYANELPEIRQKLAAEPIADDVRDEWLKHLERHMNNSFDMSGHFIGVLTTKKVEEFDAALRKKIDGGGVP